LNLDGLFLDDFGAVDHMTALSRGDERAVRVLGKVMMAGRIQNVDMVAFEFELHRAGRDGNPLCFSMSIQSLVACLAAFARLDGARLTDRAAVQKQFFGQCRFACVGMGI
jgi:hypothetical protein